VKFNFRKQSLKISSKNKEITETVLRNITVEKIDLYKVALTLQRFIVFFTKTLKHGPIFFGDTFSYITSLYTTLASLLCDFYDLQLINDGIKNRKTLYQMPLEFYHHVTMATKMETR
jgi:hypothetical protein